jgi:uncharacterized RDD family membrane protein YckC
MHDQTGVNPYAAPTAHIQQLAVPLDELQKSSRGARLGAHVLDSLMVLIPLLPLYGMIFAAVANRGGDTSDLGPMMTAMLVVAGIGMLALAIINLVMLYRSGQTLGKKFVGIRIVRNDGSRAGLVRIFLLRYLVPAVISILPLIGLVWYFVDSLFIFADDRRTLHDRIADTIVVDA